MDLHDNGGAGWIGVDLDGTLAKYDKWRGFFHVGAPIGKMKSRVEKWLCDGREVRIVTARVAPPTDGSKFPKLQVEIARNVVMRWLKDNIDGGEKITKVTHEKDNEMLELWDDRAVQVEQNTGRQIGVSKLAEILDLKHPDTRKAFLKFLNRHDVVGHRTTAGKEVVEQGQVLSSAELGSKGILKNVEGGEVGKRVSRVPETKEHLKSEIFVSRGGLLNEKSYGDVGILAVCPAAVDSPYLNTFTREAVIPPLDSGNPPRLPIGKGYVVAPRRKIVAFEKVRPEFKYVASEDVTGELAEALYHPVYSKLEVLRRWAPALADGTAKAPI